MGTAVLFGGISGWIGGAGANKNLELTNLIDSGRKSIKREIRRANQSYAEKAISSTASYVVNKVVTTASSASVRYYAGTQLANAASCVVPKAFSGVLEMF